MEPRKQNLFTKKIGNIGHQIVVCNKQARQYAICVSQKGISIGKDDCGRQFDQLMICIGSGGKARK